jgi:hypothetical protein
VKEEVMRRIIAGSMVVVAAALLLAGGRAQAAEETLADSVKKACSKEIATYCKGVREGQGRIFACLYAFQDKLSDKCNYALYDAASQLEQASTALKFVKSQCQADFDKFCSDVKLGEGRGLACLQKHDKEVSQQCKDALQQTGLTKAAAKKK